MNDESVSVGTIVKYQGERWVIRQVLPVWNQATTYIILPEDETKGVDPRIVDGSEIERLS
ncbi:MAG: hypothetical protein DMF62_02550 [Acidobacteria bacterium]|nr:MAG: hypothetical protein DMF62_02550 [Acidobacteriota bacterium]